MGSFDHFVDPCRSRLRASASPRLLLRDGLHFAGLDGERSRFGCIAAARDLHFANVAALLANAQGVKGVLRFYFGALRLLGQNAGGVLEESLCGHLLLAGYIALATGDGEGVDVRLLAGGVDVVIESGGDLGAACDVDAGAALHAAEGGLHGVGYTGLFRAVL